MKCKFDIVADLDSIEGARAREVFQELIKSIENGYHLK